GKMSPELRQQLVGYLRELADELGTDLSNITIYECEFAPIRIQHLINELGKKGYVVLETLVLNGRFFLLTMKKSDKDLKLAIDYEFRG
ncbi:MAG: hypothetical protein J7L51_01910, partial [Desulfurococcales archaeon]|nr:hypothetical protein [Desulfurococcales archaeon]